MTPEHLKNLLEEDFDGLLVDVREPYEYEICNIGGTLIPLGELKTNLHLMEPYRHGTIVIHCQSGKRSAAAREFLHRCGFSGVVDLNGGLDNWLSYYPCLMMA
jgi:rhodanese-related sulfurtransferase